MAKRLLGVCYLAAFISLYTQFDGLLSYNGLLPIDLYMSRIKSQLLGHSIQYEKNNKIQNTPVTTGTNLIHDFSVFPSLMIVSEYIGVSTYAMYECLSLLGILLSIPIVCGYTNILLFIICWASYLSLQLVSQTWLSFQWDILLLETGFLAIITSFIPFTSLQFSSITYTQTYIHRQCYQFLAWKLMFLSGIVKLKSKCPTWEGLTALMYHFATQCLPTPLAWLAHQAPPICLKLLVILTLLVEIPWTFLLLCPIDYPRVLGVYLQIIFQISIILTGNYTFFNLLTIYLMLEILTNIPNQQDKIVVKEQHPSILYTSMIIPSLTWIFIAFSTSLFITFQPLKSDYLSEKWWIGNNITLNLKWDNISMYMNSIVIIAIIIPMCMICISTIVYLIQSIRIFIYNFNNINLINKSINTLITNLVIIIQCLIALSWILLSATQLGEISTIPEYLPKVPLFIQRLRLVSSYGLFRSMTGVSIDQYSIGNSSFHYVARPELILEGYDINTSHWREIDFRHKPGQLSSIPSIIAPYQPRLDWQMWFAALSTYSNNPWLTHLLYKLLNNDNIAIKLLNKNYPFLHTPPLAIRVRKYEYDFTRLNTPWAIANPRADFNMKHWYSRRFISEYLPSIEANNSSVRDFLLSYGLDPDRTYAPLSKSHMFTQCMHMKPLIVIHSNTYVAFVLLIKHIICRCLLVKETFLRFSPF